MISLLVTVRRESYGDFFPSLVNCTFHVYPISSDWCLVSHVPFVKRIFLLAVYSGRRVSANSVLLFGFL